ncbi:MAG: hypothetical protein F9K15_13405 [Zoogloea sp.]|nr:MAG: hypothetical protein F9K15_13405 [Zoogloea sp.]
MSAYYVNKNAQPNSKDHEVHKEGCTWMPESQNRIYLGDFSNCRDAVKKAKQFFSDTNGCYYCSNECHTT